MSRRVEYFDAAGLRKDGRRALELRDCSFVIGNSGNLSFSNLNVTENENDQEQNENQDSATSSSTKTQQQNQQQQKQEHITSSSGRNADGSAEIISNSSHVRALVYGPRHAQFRDSMPDSAHLSCEVTALRRRGGGATRRARSAELSSLVMEALQPVLMLAQYPFSAIHIHVDVLQSDGDEEVACINAASLALADACIAMRDIVVATQVCFLDSKHVVVDPTFEELRSGCPRWIEAVFAHQPSMIAMLHEEGRYKKEQEEDAKDSLHAACFTASVSYATKMLESLREHTNSQLAILEGKY